MIIYGNIIPYHLPQFQIYIYLNYLHLVRYTLFAIRYRKSHQDTRSPSHKDTRAHLWATRRVGKSHTQVISLPSLTSNRPHCIIEVLIMRIYVDTSVINGLYAQDKRIKEITELSSESSNMPIIFSTVLK